MELCIKNPDVPVRFLAVAVGDQVGLAGHLVLVAAHRPADRRQVNLGLADRTC
jgi:hypothetical protein